MPEPLTAAMLDELERPLIGPEPLYPTPWRVAEFDGKHHVVTAFGGSYVALVPDVRLAELIVIAVNNAAALTPDSRLSRIVEMVKAYAREGDDIDGETVLRIAEGLEDG